MKYIHVLEISLSADMRLETKELEAIDLLVMLHKSVFYTSRPKAFQAMEMTANRGYLHNDIDGMELIGGNTHKDGFVRAYYDHVRDKYVQFKCYKKEVK